MNKIPQFKDEYSFLSNFYPCQVFYGNKFFPSAEHAYKAYQYCYTNNINFYSEFKDIFLLKCLDTNTSAGVIKKMSRSFIHLIPQDFHNLKVVIMSEILHDKFTRNIDLQSKLLDTKDLTLIEGNNWGDKFWGMCLRTNEGKNKLGKILMNIRSSIQKGENNA